MLSTTPLEDSSLPSRKTPSTINNSSRRANWRCQCWRSAATHCYGLHLATEIGFAAANVRAAVIEHSGHWIMEEQPEQAVTVILSFLRANQSRDKPSPRHKSALEAKRTRTGRHDRWLRSRITPVGTLARHGLLHCKMIILSPVILVTCLARD